jgi:hypothetical protein
MNMVNRRNFLWMAGAAGAVTPVVAALDLAAPVARTTTESTRGDVYTFHAVAALPAQPLPAYASYVLTGHLDPKSGSGTISQTVFAGGPGATSEIAFPGLSRSIRVTDVAQVGDNLNVKGVVDDRSQLRPGETPNVEIQIDRSRGIVSTEFLGAPTQLELMG